MAGTIDDLIKMLGDTRDELIRAIDQAKINPDQVQIVSLSDLSKTMGLIQAGEFRAGNSIEPGLGFTGVRMGYPPFSYSSLLWHLVGVSNDALQFGLSADDGKAYFGGGVDVIDSKGIHVYDAGGKPAFIALSAAETINSESLGAGDVLIGDNSSDKPNVLWDQSAGVMYFRSGTTSFNKLSPGAALSAYGCRVRRSTDQSISDVTYTNIQFDIEDYDDAGFANLVSNNTRITIPTGYDGRYLIGFNIGWANAATGARFGFIRMNGSLAVCGDYVSPDVDLKIVQSATAEIEMEAGDYVQLEVLQTSGASLDIEADGLAGSPAYPVMWLHKIG
jgi:hypothetical protein